MPYKIETVPLKCPTCKIDFTISTDAYRRKRNIGKVWECNTCRLRTQGNKQWENISDEAKVEFSKKMSEQTTKQWQTMSAETISSRNKKISDNKKEYYANLSEDDRKKISDKSRDQMIKLLEVNPLLKDQLIKRLRDYELARTNEEKKAQYEKISEKVKEYWRNMSDEEYMDWKRRHYKRYREYLDSIEIHPLASYKQNMTEEQRNSWRIKQREWWDSLTEEELEEWSNRAKNYWSNLSEEERERVSDIQRERSLKYWGELSPEEYKRRSEQSKKYWADMTPEDFEKWKLGHAKGYNRYFNNLDIIPNKNESSFIDKLVEFGIREYDYQYYNIIRHDEFRQIFPINPVTNSDLVSPYHAWDFIIHIKDGSILVDIDGSIHDPNQSTFNVTDKYGNIFLLNDIIKFNDSKRPYQTDGMDAYVILCYDDELKDDTPVIKLNSDIKMNFKEFIGMIGWNLLSKKEQKKLIREAL